MADKTKILIIGGTGYIGKFIVEASAKSGHPTFVLVRQSTISDPVKGKLIDGFKNSGVTILTVSIYTAECCCLYHQLSVEIGGDDNDDDDCGNCVG